MRCLWLCIVSTALMAVASPSSAQPVTQPRDGKLVIAISASPAAIPLRALKYQLLPELRDQQPGNQIQAFYKCFMEQHAFYHDKSEIAKRERWSVAPLVELADEKALIGYGGSGLRQADFAARLESVDWAILLQFKADGINLLLPDVQQLRQLAGALRVRMRGEVARKDFEAAIRTAQTMFALASSFNQHPTLIGQLVGIAIATMTLSVVEEFVQQPGAPNLFWALADLPTPFIDLRKGMQGERVWVPKEYQLLRKAEPIPEAELKRRIKELTDWLQVGEENKKRTPPAEWYAGEAGNATKLTAAKERLAKHGHKPADLDRLSPLQIVMMDDFARYEIFHDHLTKWSNLPYWQLPTDVASAKQPEGILPELAPAAIKVVQARTRLQQYLCLMQAVEAVRAFAAENEGKLPASLEATKLPVPVDPVTGKSFHYELKDGVAIIRGTPPLERKSEPAFNRVFQISIRK
jgi:hypothetical protein